MLRPAVLVVPKGSKVRSRMLGSVMGILVVIRICKERRTELLEARTFSARRADRRSAKLCDYWASDPFLEMT